MQIPLDRFEQVIDEKILKHGLSYFKKGLVRDLDEVSYGVFEAVVEGSEEYTVQLTVKNNVVVEHRCDCPYDFGPVCKHEAAVIFALQEETLGLVEPKTRKKKASSAPKEKSITEQVKEVLGKASKEELLQLINNEAKRNATFRNQILTDLEHYNDNMSKEMYVQQIKAIVKAATGKYGFIDYRGSIAVGRSVSQILGTARKYIENHQYHKALPICFAVLESMTKAINEADDSNGDIGECIYNACDILSQVAIDCDTSEIRRQVFDYCTRQFEANTFAGWDWHLFMLSIAESSADGEEDYNRIIALTELPQTSDYTKEKCQAIKYNALLKIKGKTVADDFLFKNLKNVTLRRIAIEKAMENKDFDLASKLAKDGAEQDKDKPGLVLDWYECLLKIAQKQNNIEKIVEYSRWLLIIDSHRSRTDYYKILKQNVKPEEWETFVNAIISDIKKQGRWFDKELVAKIYIAEEWWPRLWNMVKSNPELYEIEKYESYLSKYYAKELAELYSVEILQYLERNVDRASYQSACRYIRRIIKLGEQTTATELIATLRDKYPKRRALMEELDMV